MWFERAGFVLLTSPAQAVTAQTKQAETLHTQQKGLTMDINELVAYILVWPVMSAGILVLLIASLVRDIIAARRAGRRML